MNDLKLALSSLFDWKKNPASVFLFAIPLFVLGFGMMIALAYLHYKANGDYVYGIIVGVAVLALPILIYPVYKSYLSSLKMQKVLDKLIEDNKKLKTIK